MKNVLFRADAYSGIGTGDLISLINLSEYFIDSGWQAFYFIKDHETAIKITQKRDLQNITWFSKDATLAEEISALNEVLINRSITASFFEITDGSIMDYKGLKRTPIKAAISFDGKLPNDLDIVIDWDVAAEGFFKQDQNPGTTFFLGPEYVLLSKAYANISPSIAVRTDPPKKVLICMGGIDEYDMTSRIVDIMIGSELDVEMTIIVGAGYSGVETITKKIAGTKHCIKIDVADMLKEYLNCDIAIGAGGLGSSELAASSTPAVLIATHPHQVARCEYFQTQGWARYLGLLDLNKGAFIEALTTPVSPAKPFELKVKKIIQRTEEIYAKYHG